MSYVVNPEKFVRNPVTGLFDYYVETLPQVAKTPSDVIVTGTTINTLSANRPKTHLVNMPGKSAVDFQEGETWVQEAATVAADTTAATKGVGVQSLKLTSTSTGSLVHAKGYTTKASPWTWDYANYPVMEFLFYVDDVTKLSALRFFFSIHATSVSGVKYGTVEYNAGEALNYAFPTPKNGWNLIRVHYSNFTAMNAFTASDWANINSVHVWATAVANQTVNVWMSSIRTVKLRPVFMLDHDDTKASMYPAYAIEENYGLRSNNYAVTSWVGSDDAVYLTWAQLEELYAKGHDICSHTDTHPQATIAAMSQAECKVEFLAAWRKLLARGFTRSCCFLATPGGITSANILAATPEFYTTLRNSRIENTLGKSVKAAMYPNNRDIPVLNTYGYGQYGFIEIKNSDGIDAIRTRIDATIASGGLDILLTHIIGSAAGDMTLATYTAVCQYLAAKRDAGLCDIVTMSEFTGSGNRAL